AGRGKFDRFTVAEQEGVVPFRLTSRGLVFRQRLVAIEKCGPGGEIILAEKPVDRGRHEIGIAEITLAVGKGEPLGVADETPALRVLRAKAADVEILENAEHLPDGNASG